MSRRVNCDLLAAINHCSLLYGDGQVASKWKENRKRRSNEKFEANGQKAFMSAQSIGADRPEAINSRRSAKAGANIPELEKLPSL